MTAHKLALDRPSIESAVVTANAVLHSSGWHLKATFGDPVDAETLRLFTAHYRSWLPPRFGEFLSNQNGLTLDLAFEKKHIYDQQIRIFDIDTLIKQMHALSEIFDLDGASAGAQERIPRAYVPFGDYLSDVSYLCFQLDGTVIDAWNEIHPLDWPGSQSATSFDEFLLKLFEALRRQMPIYYWIDSQTLQQVTENV